MAALFGIIVAGLGQKLTTNFWLIAIFAPILFGGFLLLDGFISGLIDQVFPSRIRPARKLLAERRKPLPRLLSLPGGIFLGVVLVWLGLGGSLLEMI